MDPVVDGCRQMIRKGSRSFAGAARLIPSATRESVYMLYAWCRHCDDRIDQQDLGRNAPAHAGSAAERLEELEQQTRAALRGEPSEALPPSGPSPASSSDTGSPRPTRSSSCTGSGWTSRTDAT